MITDIPHAATLRAVREAIRSAQRDYKLYSDCHASFGPVLMELDATLRSLSPSTARRGESPDEVAVPGGASCGPPRGSRGSVASEGEPGEVAGYVERLTYCAASNCLALATEGHFCRTHQPAPTPTAPAGGDPVREALGQANEALCFATGVLMRPVTDGPPDDETLRARISCIVAQASVAAALSTPPPPPSDAVREALRALVAKLDSAARYVLEVREGAIEPELSAARAALDSPPVDPVRGQLMEALRLILPLAKGYAAEHPVGSNAAYVIDATAALRAAERTT